MLLQVSPVVEKTAEDGVCVVQGTTGQSSAWHVFPGTDMCLLSCEILQRTHCQSEGRTGPSGTERPPSLIIPPW